MTFEVNGHNIFLIVSICFLSSLIFVEMMRRVAIFLKVLDVPNEKRKIQKEPVPLLGGIGIFLAFLLGYMLFAPKNDLMLSILISAFLIILLMDTSSKGTLENSSLLACISLFCFSFDKLFNKKDSTLLDMVNFIACKYDKKIYYMDNFKHIR